MFDPGITLQLKAMPLFCLLNIISPSSNAGPYTSTTHFNYNTIYVNLLNSLFVQKEKKKSTTRKIFDLKNLNQKSPGPKENAPKAICRGSKEVKVNLKKYTIHGILGVANIP